MAAARGLGGCSRGLGGCSRGWVAAAGAGWLQQGAGWQSPGRRLNVRASAISTHPLVIELPKGILWRPEEM